MNCFERALIFAVEAHRDQTTEKNTPYIVHPTETASVAAGRAEDLEVIAAEFGEPIAGLIQAVSENKREAQPKEKTWELRKQETIDALNKEKGLSVKMLAVADKLSNIRTIYRDHLVLGNRLWARFNQKDPKIYAWYYRSVPEAAKDLIYF